MALHHFQNYYSYIPTTRGERVSNTVELTSSEERLTQLTQDLIVVLQQSHPKTPFLDQGDKTAKLKKINYPKNMTHITLHHLQGC
jgi:hypothetical protein